MEQPIVFTLLIGSFSFQTNTIGVYRSIHASEGQYLQNRAPLKSKPFLELHLDPIKPKGFLREQLKRQKNGLTGNLDEVYTVVVGDRNSWLGAKAGKEALTRSTGYFHWPISLMINNYLPSQQGGAKTSKENKKLNWRRSPWYRMGLLQSGSLNFPFLTFTDV